MIDDEGVPGFDRENRSLFSAFRVSSSIRNQFVQNLIAKLKNLAYNAKRTVAGLFAQPTSFAYATA